MNKRSNCLLVAGWAIVGLGIAGCDSPDPPAFRLNMVQMVSDDTPTPPEYQQAIANVLGAMFGTPDEPYALPETGLDNRLLALAAGPAWSDEEGVNFGLYRKHCVHCHGITGDGQGPTARFLNPYPRDYRQGIYKFKSTYNPAKPTDEDLYRILVNGVPGTAMPSFSLLPETELRALVEYVKYLSIRGQMESALAQFAYFDLGEEEAYDDDGEPILDDEGEPVMRLIPLDPTSDPEQREIVLDIMTGIVEEWEAAEEAVIEPDEEQIPEDNRSPEELQASIDAGRELFYGTRANCFTCHGPTGMGDGQQDDYDVWNKAHQQFHERLNSGSEEEVAAERVAVADGIYPVRNAIPRNLRDGVYRGGRRRIDIFWRVYAGIAGTPMPGSGASAPGAQGTLTDAEMWNIVDYVLSLPYEAPSMPQQAVPVNTESVN